MAQSTFPNKLYKFRNFDSITVDMIFQGAVHFAQPQTFNDPYDSGLKVKPDMPAEKLWEVLPDVIRKVHGETQAEARDTFLTFLENPDFVGMSPEEERRAHDAITYQFLASLIHFKFKDIGVFCLSNALKNPLMWAHYANHHRGLCLEYDHAFGRGCGVDVRRVNYTAEKAVTDSDAVAWLLEDNKEAARRIKEAYFFTKSKEWKYEKEWRVVTEPYGSESSPLDLTGIIFGDKCPLGVQVAVMNLFRDIQKRYRPKFYELYNTPRGLKRRASRLTDREMLPKPGWNRERSELIQGFDDDSEDSRETQ